MEEFLITPTELKENINNYRIVDLRPYSNYKRSHIAGAVHAPINIHLSDENHNLININHFASLMSSLGINNETPIAVYDDNLNKSSCLFWYMMKYYGNHKIVRVLDGGWQGATTLPVDTNQTPIPFTYYNPLKQSNYIYYLPNLIHNFKNVKIVDTRTKGEWDGTDLYNNPRQGRIPSSVFIAFDEFLPLQRTQTFADKNKLEKMAKNANLQKEDIIVTYCQHGARAALCGLALRSIGYNNVIVYEGSMYEWSRHLALALE